MCLHLDRHISHPHMHFVSLHGCGWQLRALVLWKGGFFAAAPGIPQQSPAHYQGYPWRWDKGSRTAKVGLSRGKVMAMQLELAGIMYGAGTVRTRRNHEVGAIRMRVCDPNWEGTFSSVGSGWPLSCCRSHSAPSGLTATPQPVSSLPGQGPRKAFWRKGNDVTVWKTWSCRMCAFGPQHTAFRPCQAEAPKGAVLSPCPCRDTCFPMTNISMLG